MIIDANESTNVTIDGKRYLYFGGTNYLGLSHRPELIEASQSTFARFGFSSGASRLTSGNNRPIVELEERLAHFGQAEAALVLPAGYMSNQAVVDGLDPIVDCWVVNKNAHGSIKSAVAGSTKPIVFDESPSAVPGKLRDRLGISAKRLGVFAEPIEALTGRLYDVPMLAQSCQPDDYLILDEAHSFGVLGSTGVGAKERYQLGSYPINLVRSGTFSKAVGTYGGFVLADDEVIAGIKKYSGCYKVSTTLSPVVCAATLAALKLMAEQADTTVGQLHENIKLMNQRLTVECACKYDGNEVPIYFLENNAAVTKLRNALPEAGIFLPSMTTYFAGTSEIGLRWTIQAGHTASDFDRLISNIKQYTHD